MLSLKNFNWGFFLTILFIVCLGTVTIISVNPALSQVQIIYVVFSFFLFFFFSALDFSVLEGLAGIFYLATIFFLLIPFFFGVVSRGAVRWIQVGSLTFQPSELAKFFLIIFFSKFWLARRFNLKNLLIYLGYLSLPFVLVFKQPDLGSSLVIVAIAFGMIFLTEIDFKQMIAFCLVTILIIPLTWPLLKDYQRERIEHFLNPGLEPLGVGYNVIQSIISVGSGGWLGKGFGRGTQSHLAFLPERHTDFIFASFAEEFGLLGTFALIFFYLILLGSLLKTAKNTKTRFGFNLVMGIFFFIFFQTLVNIGMNLGILPVTGITLPLFSYGGNSLLVTMMSLGMAVSVSRLKNQSPEIEIGLKNYP